MAIAGGRVTMTVPEGMRALSDEEVMRYYGTGSHPEVMLVSLDSTAFADLRTFNEVARVDSPSFREARYRTTARMPRFGRWIARDVVEQGGARWLHQDYTVRGARREADRRRRVYVTGMDGRSVVVELDSYVISAEWEEKLTQAAASLEVHACAPAAALAGTGRPAPRGGLTVGPVCEQSELRAHVMAGDQRRVNLRDGRVSFIPPPLRELSSVEIERSVRRGTLPVVAFAGDSAWVTVRVLPGVADLDDPGFRARWEHSLEGDRRDNTRWIAREVVTVGGTRWLKLDFVTYLDFPNQRHEVAYLTPFQGQTLAFQFQGLPRHAAALEESAATIEARDCQMVRPMSAWVDSAALARAAATLPGPQLPPEMKPLFRVGFDTAGVLTVVEPVYDQIPAEYAAAVTAAIRASVKPQPRWIASTEYLVRVAGGPTPLVDAPEVVVRPPMLNNAELISSQLGNINPAPRFRPGLTRQLSPGIYVGLRVLADGHPDLESIRLVRTPDLPSVGNQVLRAARDMRFTPGEVDGIRAPLRVVIPIAF